MFRGGQQDYANQHYAVTHNPVQVFGDLVTDFVVTDLKQAGRLRSQRPPFHLDRSPSP